MNQLTTSNIDNNISSDNEYCIYCRKLLTNDNRQIINEISSQECLVCIGLLNDYNADRTSISELWQLFGKTVSVWVRHPREGWINAPATIIEFPLRDKHLITSSDYHFEIKRKRKEPKLVFSGSLYEYYRRFRKQDNVQMNDPVVTLDFSSHQGYGVSWFGKLQFPISVVEFENEISLAQVLQSKEYFQQVILNESQNEE